MDELLRPVCIDPVILFDKTDDMRIKYRDEFTTSDIGIPNNHHPAAQVNLM